MLNPKIIYLLVAVVFIYIVAKFKLMPYLAARKILKDGKNNGTQQTSAQTLTDQVAPAIPLQFLAAMQQGQALGNISAPSASGNIPKFERREVHFDYTLVDLSCDPDDPDADVSNDPAQIVESINSAARQYIAFLRKHCVDPDFLGIVHLTDRAFMIYVTYTP